MFIAKAMSKTINPVTKSLLHANIQVILYHLYETRRYSSIARWDNINVFVGGKMHKCSDLDIQIKWKRIVNSSCLNKKLEKIQIITKSECRSLETDTFNNFPLHAAVATSTAPKMSPISPPQSVPSFSSKSPSKTLTTAPNSTRSCNRIHCELKKASAAPQKWTIDCVSSTDPIHIILKPPNSALLPSPMDSSLKNSKRVCLFYCSEMRDLAERIASESDAIELRSITWRWTFSNLRGISMSFFDFRDECLQHLMRLVSIVILIGLNLEIAFELSNFGIMQW